MTLIVCEHYFDNGVCTQCGMRKKSIKHIVPDLNCYCPRCGETGTIAVTDITPGSLEWRCDSCGCPWRIDFRFYTIDDD